MDSAKLDLMWLLKDSHGGPCSHRRPSRPSGRQRFPSAPSPLPKKVLCRWLLPHQRRAHQKLREYDPVHSFGAFLELLSIFHLCLLSL